MEEVEEDVDGLTRIRRSLHMLHGIQGCDRGKQVFMWLVYVGFV